MLRLFLISVLVLFGAAQAAPLSFETKSAGDIITALQHDGVNVTVNSTIVNGAPSAMIFDSRNPTGGDDDLGGPFTDALGSGLPVSPGNILINSEYGDSSDPDDKASGGYIEFLFDVPVTFEQFYAFDANRVGQIKLELFDESGSLGTVANTVAGSANSFEVVEFAASDVVRAVFNLTRGGAIGELSFYHAELNDGAFAQTPLPASATLFFAGAGFFLWQASGNRRQPERRIHPR